MGRGAAYSLGWSYSVGSDFNSLCHTCPLNRPEILQLFVRGWQHADTWVNRERERGGKWKVIWKQKKWCKWKKEAKNGSSPRIRPQLSPVMEWEKLQHVLAALVRWQSKWLNMWGTPKEFTAMTALLSALGMHRKSNTDARKKISAKN